MINYAGIALFVFGNKKDIHGNIVLSDGMRQEFDLCVKGGVHPLPVGATGYMAKLFWNEVWTNFNKFYPNVSKDFRKQFKNLGDSSKRPEELLVIIQKLIEFLQKG